MEEGIIVDEARPSRVLIVEDHGLLAESLVLALRSEGLQANAVAPSTVEQIVEAAAAAAPTVVLLDLELGGAIGDSLGLIKPLSDLGALVVMLTGVTDRMRLAACLEAGATGLLDKSMSFDRLVDAVGEVAELGTLITRAQRDTMLAELRAQRGAARARLEPFQRLTARERQVLAELMRGRTAEAIAKEAYVSLSTVRSQIRAILLKLDVNTQLAAVALARENGWSLDAPGSA